MNRTTRVRYKVNPSTNQVESTQSYLGNNGILFRVLITRTNDRGYVVQVGDGTTNTVSENITSLSKAKSMAKAVLIEQGVEFYDEVRNKNETV